MTPQTEFLDLICDTAERNCDLGAEISLKELPAEGGIYAELGEGIGDSPYYDKSAVRTMPVLFLCRDADQRRGMDRLCRICNYMQGLRQYPQGRTVSWLDARVAKEPNKIGRDDDGVYHFSCILNCQIYF